MLKFVLKCFRFSWRADTTEFPTQEALRNEKSLQTRGQHGLYCEFRDIKTLSLILKCCLFSTLNGKKD